MNDMKYGLCINSTECELKKYFRLEQLAPHIYEVMDSFSYDTTFDDIQRRKKIIMLVIERGPNIYEVDGFYSNYSSLHNFLVTRDNTKEDHERLLIIPISIGTTVVCINNGENIPLFVHQYIEGCFNMRQYESMMNFIIENSAKLSGKKKFIQNNFTIVEKNGVRVFVRRLCVERVVKN